MNTHVHKTGRVMLYKKSDVSALRVLSLWSGMSPKSKFMCGDLVSSLALLGAAQNVKTYDLLVCFSSQELYPVGGLWKLSSSSSSPTTEWTLCCNRSRGAVCLHSKELEPQDSQDKPFSSPANFLLASCADKKADHHLDRMNDMDSYTTATEQATILRL